VERALADELVATIRAWVAKEVTPEASQLEHADAYPERWVGQMQQFGLFGSRIPPEHGGLDLDTLTYARLMEELSYGWMSLAGVLNTHTITATLIARHGPEDMKARILPAMAAGEKRGAFSLSEPDAGSDAASIRCRAERDGAEYVLNGTKMWVTNGERASPPAPPKGSPASSSRRSPAPALAGSPSPARSASSATRASRRSR
jgi:alkylation response protein AidB-like acyl-CoA dehydrogenase